MSDRARMAVEAANRAVLDALRGMPPVDELTRLAIYGAVAAGVNAAVRVMVPDAFPSLPEAPDEA